MIKNLKPDDAGRYQCKEYPDSNGSIIADYLLRLRGELKPYKPRGDTSTGDKNKFPAAPAFRGKRLNETNCLSRLATRFAEECGSGD